MIVVKIKGGLGNQLFQFAVGLSLAIRNKTQLLLDISFYSLSYNKDIITPRDFGLKELNGDLHIARQNDVDFFFKRNLVQKIIKKIIMKKIRIIKNDSVVFDEGILEADGHIYLDGYFQSYLYFNHIKNELIRFFPLNTNCDLINNCFKLKPEEVSVCIHVRLGDYLSIPDVASRMPVCTKEYYKKSIEYIEANVIAPVYYVFSDTPNLVTNYIPEGIQIITVDPLGELSGVDIFNLMRMCNHFIIANSTLSWWAAWLRNEDCIVVAPKVWINDANFVSNNLIPPAWKVF